MDIRQKANGTETLLSKGTIAHEEDVKKAVMLGYMLALANTLKCILRGVGQAVLQEKNEEWETARSVQVVSDLICCMDEFGEQVVLYFQGNFAKEHAEEVGEILKITNKFIVSHSFNGVKTVEQFALTTKKSFADLYSLIIENGCKLAGIQF